MLRMEREGGGGTEPRMTDACGCADAMLVVDEKK